MMKQSLVDVCVNNVMLTRKAAEMSEHAYHAAIIEVAHDEFAHGLYTGAQYDALKHSYLSVIAPDRYGAIEQMMALPIMRNQQLQKMKLQDSFGHDMLIYHREDGWREIITPPEMARAIEFHALYEECWYALQSAHVS